MRYLKFAALIILSAAAAGHADDPKNNEEGPGFWNQNPHRYGNWNRNQYENEQGAYQKNQNASQGQYQYQNQNQNNPQNRSNPTYQNRQIATDEGNPTPANKSPSDQNVYSQNPGRTLPQGTHDDTKITREIQENLLRDSSLSTQARQSIVSTSNGVVTLSGQVLTPDEVAKVQALVQKIEGVKSVENQLQPMNASNAVNPIAPPPPQQEHE